MPMPPLRAPDGAPDRRKSFPTPSCLAGETSPEDIAGLQALKASICGSQTDCLPSWDLSLPTADPCLDGFQVRGCAGCLAGQQR